MTRAMDMAVVFLMASAVVQANQCSGGSGCQSDINPSNVASVLETKLQMGALNDGGEDNPCSSGGECPSDDSPKHVVSMFQTKLLMHMLDVRGEESSSEALRGGGPGKKEPRQLDMLIMKNSSAMLSEVEGIIDAGEAPAFDIIAKISSIVKSELMPDLATLRSLSIQDTNGFSDAIHLCNNNSKAKVREIEGGMQVSVNEARLLHAACRDSEKLMYNHNWTNDDSYCVKLGNFLHVAAKLTLHIPPSASTRDAAVEYVEQASDTNLCGGSEVRGLADSCAAKEEELTSKSDDCDTKQASFEVDFCTWKTQLESNCEALDTCHSDAVTAYDKHVAKSRTLMQKWDAETATLQKILCYCSAWLSAKDAGDNRSQHNASQFEACKDQTHTPGPVNYGTRPEKVACLLTSVANHPGTPGFITQEYSTFLEFVQAVVPCPRATTAAPTTVAPTQAPTTEVPTTEAPTTEAPTTEATKGTCKPKSTSSSTDEGYADNYRGWYDVQGCGFCYDYCRWVGNAGNHGDHGDPAINGTHDEEGKTQSWWSCRLAGESKGHTDKGAYPTWAFGKCAGEGEAPTTEVPTTEAPTTEAPTTEAR